MGSVHDVFKDDETSGTIVGGEYVCGHLYYGERQALYRQLWAGSETELQQKAKLTLVSSTSIVEGGYHDVILKDKGLTPVE